MPGRSHSGLSAHAVSAPPFLPEVGGLCLSETTEVQRQDFAVCPVSFGGTDTLYERFLLSVHRSGGIGNPRLHLSYERQMQRYFMENLDLFTAENRMMQIPQTVTEVLQTYYRQPSMDFHTDLSAAIQASLVVCKKYALLVQQKQAFSGGVPNGSCHSGI